MRYFLVLLASICIGAAPAAACSVKKGYRIPTNFELVQQAKVIVVAKVTKVPASLESAQNDPESSLVEIEPIRFLKGTAPASGLRLMGWRPPKNWDGIPTPTTLAQSHFSAGLGACIRQFYAPGELVVAMFDSDPSMTKISGHELNQIFHPWARSVETVDNADDIWVHAIARYVALQSGPAETLNERIKASAVELHAIRTPEAQAIASDLDYQLTRKDPTSAWGGFSFPTSTSVAVHGQKGAALYCIAGTPPGLMLEAPAAPPVELWVGSVPHVVQPASPTPVEKQIIDSPGRVTPESGEPRPSLYHFADSAKLFAALRTTSDEVQVKSGGKVLVGGRPLDALYRWANQCEKLRSLPAPAIEEPRK